MIIIFFKQFIKYGLFFGTFMGFYFIVGLGNEISVGVRQAVIAGSIYGGLYSLINISIYRYTHKKWDVPYTELGNGIVKHSDKIILKVPLDIAEKLCVDALNFLDRKYTFEETNDSSNKIMAIMKMPFWRSTDYIEFEFIPNSSNSTLVLFSSYPAMSTQSEDYGSNYQNIVRIKNFLEAAI